MNKVEIIGNLVREIEKRTTSTGKTVCNFTVAVSKKDETAYVPCVAWEKTADIMEQYCRKGDKVFIAGHLRTRSYEKDGRKVSVMEVTVDEVVFFKTDKPEPQLPYVDDEFYF